MAALKLRRTADGIGATFPDELLDLLKVGEGDLLDMRATPEGILLTVSGAPREEVMGAARRIMEEHADVLRVLAT